MISKIIPGLKGIHAISEDGKVINTITGRVLKTSVGTTGYERVSINLEKGRVANLKIHRAVAEAFVAGRTDKRNHVNHIDGNKLNNHPSNLEWCTAKENNNHAVKAGLNDLLKPRNKSEPVELRNKRMKELYLTERITHREIARLFGVSGGHASKILKGLTRAA